MAKNKEVIAQQVCMSAINPYIELNIPKAVEVEVRGKEFVSYGEHNDYPDFLYGLYEEVPTLSSIINGTTDYICGNEVTCNVDRFKSYVNIKQETINDVFEKCAMDRLIFGGYYINVIRDLNGNVCELYHLDYRNVRTDKKNEVFYYSEDWSKSYGRVKYLMYPKFIASMNQPSSVLFVKGAKNRDVYSKPLYYSAIKSCEIERKINEYHLNSISNGFTASYLINFNNGQPSDELKNEIEKNVNEKFSGSENSGRIMMSFNSDKEHSAEIIPLEIQDFGEKYNTLANRSKQQISIVFGCNLNLFGNISDSLGFNSEEYMSTFTLYNKTRVLPIQKEMIDSFDKIFGIKDSITIEPFSIKFDDMDGGELKEEIIEEEV